MSPPGPRARGPRPHDTVLAVSLFCLALATLHMSPQDADAWSVGGIALSAVLTLTLTLVQARPVPALSVIAGVFLLAQATYGLVPVFALIVIVAVFRMASADATARVTGATVAAVVAVAVDFSAQLTSRDSWTDSAYLVMATAVLGSAAAGDAVRNRRAYVREVEDRARRAEYSRDQAMARRIAEERLSIARDVHDLVAHHLAVISVQAEVATHVLATRPAVAAESLGLVRDAAGSALGELGSLIGVLRGGSAAPREPSPTLAQLPQLVASFETTGLQVSRRQHGTAHPLSAAVDLAAYRLVQESLTNAHKHGSGHADVQITYSADALLIDVVNPTDPDAPTVGDGHGLLGMRERAEAVGGTVRIERSGGDRFRVLASLPTARP